MSSRNFGGPRAIHRQITLRREVEAEVGYVPWLHAYEHYGWVDPMPEVVIGRPIALVPAIAARRGAPVEVPPRGRDWDPHWTPETPEELARACFWHGIDDPPPPDSLDLTPRGISWNDNYY